MADRIELCEILARGIVGLGEAERRERQDVVVSAVLEIDLAAAGESDRVEDSVDYARIKRRIVGYVETSSHRTLETLATRITRLCLAEPRVLHATVRIEKPTAERFVKSIAVEISREQPAHQHRRPAYIVLGSNHRADTMLASAIYKLTTLGRIVARSGVYETAPSDKSSTSNYLNAAIRLDTILGPEDLQKALKDVEVELGRSREHGSPIAIDLDLCLFGSEVIATPELRLPAPQLLTESYVAVPIAEIADTLLHPAAREPMRVIADRLIQRTGAVPKRTPMVLPDV
ncbi:MAG: 2-amino-4-hydroxy-6-hydroxymethyldihydropteridine diphosphokinase [Planctomycetes bacterium]|nr:2-amino-4-hydroxy-6-hydroxymethyldihydropteridine diphosphokinase [Planctomycetota bacterium]